MVLLQNVLALGAFLVVPAALAAPNTFNRSSNFRAGLNVAAKGARKLYFGTATNADQWGDKTYFDILKDNREFGQITAANVMKWVCSSASRRILTTFSVYVKRLY